MQWKKWSDFFYDQIEILWNDCEGNVADLLKPTSHDWTQAICKVEDTHAEEVEAAIFTFIETKEWPQMSRSALILLDERLKFAGAFAAQGHYMSKQWGIRPATRRRTRSDTIQWFLVDAWEQFGFEQMMNRLRVIPLVNVEKKEPVFGRN